MRLCLSFHSNYTVEAFRLLTVPHLKSRLRQVNRFLAHNGQKPYRETTQETSGGHPYTVTLEVDLVHTGGSAKTKRFQPIIRSSVRNLSYLCGIFC